MGEGAVALILLAELIVDSVIEHLTELLASHTSESVESLETVDIADILLDVAKSGLGVVALLKDVVRNTISTDIDVHIIIVISGRVDETTDGGLGDTARAEPERVELPFLVEDSEARVDIAERDKHILVDVLLLIDLVEGLGGGKLEERDLRGDEPSEGVTEVGIVTEGQDLSHLPEDRLGVTMVVVTKGQELSSGLLFSEESTDVLEEPGLPEATNSIVGTNLSINLIDHSTSHDDSSIAGVDEALNEIETSFTSTLIQESNEILASVSRLILELNVGLSRNHHKLSSDQETNSTIRPGDGVEQLSVLSLAALDQLSARQHNIIRDTDVLEETILPRASLDSESSDQTSDSQVIQLGHDGSGQTKRVQVRSKLRDGNEGLNLDGHLLAINLEDITETRQISLEESGLVARSEDVSSLPARTSSTHGLRLVTSTDLLLEDSNSLVVLVGSRASPLDIAVADVQTPVEEERHRQNDGNDDHPAVLGRNNIDDLVTNRLAEQERQSREQHQRVPGLNLEASKLDHFRL